MGYNEINPKGTLRNEDHLRYCEIPVLVEDSSDSHDSSRELKSTSLPRLLLFLSRNVYMGYNEINPKGNKMNLSLECELSYLSDLKKKFKTELEETTDFERHLELEDQIAKVDSHIHSLLEEYPA